MKTRPRRPKDAVRGRLVTIRLLPAEFHHLRLAACRNRTTAARLIRERIADLTNL